MYENIGGKGNWSLQAVIDGSSTDSSFGSVFAFSSNSSELAVGAHTYNTDTGMLAFVGICESVAGANL